MQGQLHLLGVPRWIEGEAEVLALNKPTLLLLYLAYRAQWITRSEAAFLFRPDDDEATALKHLRQLIHRAKPYAWAEGLEARTEQLLLQVPTDVQAFRAAVQEQNWQAAIGLYGGPLFAGFDDGELYAYSAWLELERSNLQRAYEEALLRYGQALEASGDYGAAAEVLEKLLKADPLSEEALQAYLRCAYLAGQRDKALKAYSSFCQALQAELDNEALQETQDLAQQIREGKPLQGAAPAPLALRSERRSGSLPFQATRFVGRKRELQEISSQLVQPECRLLTLIGMGGVGKTRLALEVGQSLQKSFPDGVFFAPLASLGAPEEIIPKLIQVLGLKVAASQDPQAQLLGYLAEKHILLILDNLEHLSAAGVLTTLLQHTSRLKLLVTSRESLKLSAEWLFDLQGLRHPSELSDPDSLENYDAVQLFVAGVRRVAPQLELSQADIQTIARIAQELQGHPLALELASSWARIMPLKRIAQELGQGYDLLETDLADLPERHRNLRAILDTTWAGLSEKKRQTLSRFSVFVGGATLEAAERVCGSHFSLLLALVNESLLKRSAGGRLEMHGLVQQYAWGKLAQDTGPTQQQHAHYFADQLSRRFDSSLYLDSENCRRAWLWLSQEGQLDPLEGSLNGIDYLYAMTGRYREGQRLYRQSLEYLNLHPASPQRDRLMAGIINGLADQAAAIGDLESAGQQLQQSRALLDGQSGVEKQLGYVLTSLARLNWQKGDYRQAEHFLKSAAQTIAGIGDVRQETNILHGLGLVLRDQGKLAEAQECYERVLELYLGMDETGNAALTLNNIGALQISLNQPQAAQQTLQRGLALVKGLEFHRAEANLTLTYGGALYKSGDYHQARKKFLNAATLAEQTQEPTNKADALRMVGNTHLKLGDPAEAAVYLGQSLELAWQLKAWPLLLANLLDFAQLLAQTGKEGESLELLAQVLHHPASKNDTRQEARRLLGELKGELPSVGAIEEVVEGLLERYCNAWPLDSVHG